ncbi:extracellular solute-binding protein [Paenibacillus terrigena]|uniref:ABC transporter substrate-binding protein n=1 Tax=Paenibacillus terrigena TaxID=369333 RepID=UPI0028D7D0E6|nr:extracellular solute-binding protein [Paenibacillus terrigena]
MKALKFASYFLTLMLIVSVIGCSKGTDDKKEPAQPAAQQEDTTKTEPAQEEPAAEKKFDLNGQTVKIGVWWDDADPRTMKEKGPAEEAQIKLIEEAEKKYNAKIEFVKFGDYGKYVENFTVTSLSGEPFADIVRLELFWAFPQLVNKEFIQPLDEWIDVKDAKYIDWMRAGGSYKGKQYGIVDSAPSPYGIFYNKTLVQKLGLEDPYELQQKGEWTWDKFREFAKKATQDTNGDGKTDVWGLSGAYGKLKAFTEQVVYTNKGSVDKDESGEIKFSLNGPNAVEALQYVSDLFNVDKSIQQPIPDDASKEFIAGKGVMYSGFSWELGGFVENMKGQDLGYVFFPKGPKADKYVSYTPFGNMWMVSKYSKNAEAALHIIDEISLNEAGRKLSEESWQTSYPNKESMDTRKQMAGNIDYISYYAIPDGEKLFEGVVKEITEGKVSPATAIDKAKPQFEANIKKLLDSSK